MLYLGIQKKGSSQAMLLSEETQGTAERQKQGRRKGARVWTMHEAWFIATFTLLQLSNTTLRKSPKHRCVPSPKSFLGAMVTRHGSFYCILHYSQQPTVVATLPSLLPPLSLTISISP